MMRRSRLTREGTKCHLPSFPAHIDPRSRPSVYTERQAAGCGSAERGRATATWEWMGARGRSKSAESELRPSTPSLKTTLFSFLFLFSTLEYNRYG